MVEEGFGRFKLAARDLISKLPVEKRAHASIKYQVLCDETAFVGVVKQKDKASGQAIDFSIEFGKSVTSNQI